MSRERNKPQQLMIGETKECRNKDEAVRHRNNHNLNNRSAPRTPSSLLKVKSNAHSSVVLQKQDLNQMENDDHEETALDQLEPED